MHWCIYHWVEAFRWKQLWSVLCGRILMLRNLFVLHKSLVPQLCRLCSPWWEMSYVKINCCGVSTNFLLLRMIGRGGGFKAEVLFFIIKDHCIWLPWSQCSRKHLLWHWWCHRILPSSLVHLLLVWILWGFGWNWFLGNVLVSQYGKRLILNYIKGDTEYN